MLYPLIKAGKLRALAIARGERWPELPDVPTLVESGYPDFTIDAWTGVVAPAGTPAADRRQAQRGDQRRPQDAGRARRAWPNSPPSPKLAPPMTFGNFLADQTQRWGAIVKLANAKIN